MERANYQVTIGTGSLKWLPIKLLLIPFFSLLIALLVSAMSAHAAGSQATGVIEGRVIDAEDGRPVAGVNVVVEGTILGTATGRDGRYRIEPLTPGRYTLRLSRIGYASHQSESILVHGSETVTADFDLVVQAFPLDQIVVTATRTERRLKDTPVTTELITRDEIEKAGAEDISEILEERVGVRVRKSEGHGWGIQMQGLDAEYILLLIDGEEVIGRTAGVVDLRQIPVESIDHIEVVKGASSVLYGSEAMGGVVNIITKTAQAPLNMSFTSTFGSHSKADPRATLSFKQKRFSAHITASHNRSGGFDLDRSNVAHDGSPYGRSMVSGKFTYDLSPAARITISGRYYDEEYRPVSISRGSTFDTDADEQRSHGSLAFDWTPDPGQTLKVKVYGSKYERDTRKTFRASDRLDTSFEGEDQIRGEATYNRRLGSHLVTLGVDLYRESLEAVETSSVSDNVNETPNQSTITRVAYLQDEIQIATPLKLVFGGRLDHNSAFGSHISPKGALHVKIGPHVDFRGSIGRGFRAPSVRDLNRAFINFAHGYQVFGNAQLNPETSTNINAGLDAEWMSRVSGRVNVFRNDLDDAIRAEFRGKENGLSTFEYRNVDQAVTKGLEIELRIRLNRSLSLSSSYAFIASEDKKTGDELLGVSRHSADWKLEYRHARWGFDANLRGEFNGGWLFSQGRGQAATINRSPNYTTWDARIARRFNPYFKVQVGIDNLFDRVEADFEPRPGREAYAGFTIEY